jgi:hypothetical protein
MWENIYHQSIGRMKILSITYIRLQKHRQIYSRTFNTKDGRIILEDLANMSGCMRSNFVQGSSDYTSFLEGHRALFLYICSQASDEQIDNIEGNL